MSSRDRTIEVEATASVSLEDIIQHVDFPDLLDAYDMKTEEVCDYLDEDEVTAWLLQRPGFTISKFFEDDDFAQAAVDHIKASPEMMAAAGLVLADAPKPELTLEDHPSGLFSMVMADGKNRAVIVDNMNVSFMTKSGEVLKFVTKGQSDALEILTALLTVSP